MPIIKSAKKKVRVAKRNRALNLKYTKKMREEIKKYQDKPSDKQLSAAYSAIDKCVKKKIIHKNKAAHLKSKLSKFTKSKERAVKKKSTKRIRKNTKKR